MNHPESPSKSPPATAQGWDSYWHGTGDTGAFSSGGVNHPAIMAFWDQFFLGAGQDFTAPALLDIASGNGAVVERARSAFGDNPADITCVDLSEAAVENIGKRFPGVRGVVADARSIPLETGSYDLVTSQFGVEYAGPEAIDEAGRLLAPGGRAAMLLHNESSSIHRECTAALDAIARLRASDFIPLARRFFEAGFAAVRGADRAPYEAAAQQMNPAISALEDIMREHGTHVAGDMIARLYNDVAEIHGKMQNYDQDEVLGWLGRLDGELDGYAGRMSSMSECALDEPAFEQVCERLRDAGCTIEQSGAFSSPDDGLPLAWALVAAKAA